jgi:hypothetical protein
MPQKTTSIFEGSPMEFDHGGHVVGSHEMLGRGLGLRGFHKMLGKRLSAIELCTPPAEERQPVSDREVAWTVGQALGRVKGALLHPVDGPGPS